jgi:hypothetical protein
MHDPRSKSAPTQTNQSSDKLLNLLEIMTEQTEPLLLGWQGYTPCLV